MISQSQLNPKPYLEFYQQLSDEIARCYAEMLECKVGGPLAFCSLLLRPPASGSLRRAPLFRARLFTCTGPLSLRFPSAVACLFCASPAYAEIDLCDAAQAAGQAQGGRRKGESLAEDERAVSLFRTRVPESVSVDAQQHCDCVRAGRSRACRTTSCSSARSTRCRAESGCCR